MKLYERIIQCAHLFNAGANVPDDVPDRVLGLVPGLVRLRVLQQVGPVRVVLAADFADVETLHLLVYLSTGLFIAWTGYPACVSPGFGLLIIKYFKISNPNIFNITFTYF